MTLRIRLKKSPKRDIVVTYSRICDILSAKHLSTGALADYADIFKPRLNLLLGAKVNKTLAELECAQTFADRSAYLLVDIFKIASIAYYQLPGITILSDEAFDRLHRYVCEHIDALRDRGITHTILPNSFVDSATAMAVMPTTKFDLDLLYSVLSLRGEITDDIYTVIYNLNIYAPKIKLRLKNKR